MAPTTEGEIYDDDDDINAETPREPSLAERYSEAAERSDREERERDRIRDELRRAQERYEAAADEEATLWEQLKIEAGNRQERRNGSW